MGGEAGDLVAQALASTDAHIGEETLVDLEVEGEARIVLFNKDTRSLLDGLCANAALHRIRLASVAFGRDSLASIHPARLPGNSN
jgi:hypothetical protein